MSLQVIFDPQSQPSFQSVQVKGQGFTPGEKLLIQIVGGGISYSERLETFNFQVNVDGNFTKIESLPLVEPDMHWQVFVVHQRGVACASFTTHQ